MCCALACGKDERSSIGRYFSSSMMQKGNLITATLSVGNVFEKFVVILYKCWMWNVRSSYLLLLKDLIMWKLWALAQLLVFYLEFDVELLLARLVTEFPCYMILNNSLQHLGINNYRLSMIIHKIITSWH